MFFWSLPAPVWGAVCALLFSLLFRLVLGWDAYPIICCIGLPCFLIGTSTAAYIRGADDGIVDFTSTVIDHFKEDPLSWLLPWWLRDNRRK